MNKYDELMKKLKALGVGRFQVMALLQAARHYVLYKDLEKAKSFGLNRAIFYAWAKYYGPHKWPVRLYRVLEAIRKGVSETVRTMECPKGYVKVLGECISIGPRGYYMIGDQEQTPLDFDHQVIRKIKRIIDPEATWKKAVEYVSSFPRTILEDPIKFYKYVYEPVRDVFFAKILLGEKIEPPKTVIEKLVIEEKTKQRHKSIVDYIKDQGNQYGQNTDNNDKEQE